MRVIVTHAEPIPPPPPSIEKVTIELTPTEANDLMVATAVGGKLGQNAGYQFTQDKLMEISAKMKSALFPK